LLLTSSAYFIFLSALFLLYWPVARWRLACISLLLFANYFFYAKWDLFYLALIPAASLVDYLVGRGLGRAQQPARRRSSDPHEYRVALSDLPLARRCRILRCGYRDADGVRLRVVGFLPRCRQRIADHDADRTDSPRRGIRAPPSSQRRPYPGLSDGWPSLLMCGRGRSRAIRADRGSRRSCCW